MKKTLALVMVLVLIMAAFAGCGAPAAEDDVIDIGVSFQGMTPFCLSCEAYLKAEVAAYEEQGYKINLEVFDGENDPAKQIEHCENFVQKDFDVIILNPISYDGCAPAVDVAVEAGIPVITMITEVANQDKCASFCGSQHYDSGVMVAEHAIAENGESFKCVVIEGVMGIDAQIQRMKGFQDVFANYPGIEIVDFQTANWERPEAMALVENWIQSGVEFDVILSENDNMALGALEALAAAGMSDIPVYGVDGDNDALLKIQEGVYAGTALMSAESQAKHAIEYAIALAEGRTDDVDPAPVIPFEWVNKDNVADYLN